MATETLKRASCIGRVGSDARDGAPSPAPAEHRELDASLLTEALTGGRDSVQRLVDELQPTIHAEVAVVVLRRGPSDPRAVRVEVEDLVQDVWETLFRDDWRVLRKYQPNRGASLRTFVGLISQRVAIDALRSGRRNPWREQLGALRDVDAQNLLSVSFEQRLQDRNLLKQVYAQLEAELGEKGRSALESMFARDLSVDEAAVATGMTKSALYSWKKRITSRARALLARLSGSEEQR